MHYVKWESIAKPKSAGWLGIYQFDTWQKVLIAKLAAQFYTKHESLWVPFFQAKYGNRQPTFSFKRGDSYIWQLFCQSGDLIIDKMKRKIGSGLTCSVLHDSWIINFPLSRWPTFINVMLEMPNQVSDFLLDNQWNEPKLSLFFGASLVQRIISLPRLSRSASDPWVWLSTETSNLPTTLMYNDLFPSASSSITWIWKLKSQPRFQTFLWRLYQNSLPTFAWLPSRGLSGSVNCPWGCADSEDLTHIFCECPFAKQVFAYLHTFLPTFSPQVSSINLMSLPATISALLQLMGSSILRNRHCLCTHCIAAALYFIWQARNNKVHGQPFHSPRVIAINSIYQHTSKHFSSFENWDSISLLGCNDPSISWNPPPQH
ncbi:hypothetical protein AXF42_Ash010716 [Apostasia shenzhenica]|uniref:Reverse transcriptase zinc-binding domain-containing protein n=1 Tax=Apostasia shenzhenica TaxID=1088818 RepID=A0A2I0A6V4_9ASPA|nr:hypothetical protein AXF42_Ash010716 [Apostasia shenzhenica]